MTKLKDIVSFKTGKLNSNAACKNGDYPFFTCSQQTFKTNTFSFECEAVLLGGNNAAGVYPLKYFLGKFDAYQRTYIIETLDDNVLLNRFLFYTLRPKLSLMQSHSSGVTTKFLTLGILNNIEIEVPTTKIQEKIASILAAYDELIENNNKRIKILEEISQNLYQEWFVNFRFSGYEETVFVDSDLGKIPKMWFVSNVPDAIDVNPRMSFDRNVDKPFVTMGELSTNGMTFFYSERKKGGSGAKFRNHDTLMARITPCLENGKTGYVKCLDLDEVGFGSTEFIVLRSKSLCPEYVYLLSRSESFRSKAIKSMSGASGRQRVQIGCFDNYLFAHPSESILKEFKGIVEPIFQQVYLLASKNCNLCASRDLLLPKLISGEIDVSKIDIEGINDE